MPLYNMGFKCNAGRSEKLLVTSQSVKGEKVLLHDTGAKYIIQPNLNLSQTCIIAILFARNHKLLSILLNVIHAFEMFYLTMNSVYNSV